MRAHNKKQSRTVTVNQHRNGANMSTQPLPLFPVYRTQDPTLTRSRIHNIFFLSPPQQVENVRRTRADTAAAAAGSQDKQHAASARSFCATHLAVKGKHYTNVLD